MRQLVLPLTAAVLRSIRYCHFYELVQYTTLHLTTLFLALLELSLPDNKHSLPCKMIVN